MVKARRLVECSSNSHYFVLLSGLSSVSRESF